MHEKASVDFLSSNGSGGLKASGAVAMRLLQGDMDIEGLRTLDVLRKEEWNRFDEKVIEVARRRLVGIGDLQAAGLTYPVENALGVTRVEWEKMSFMEPAEVSMAGVTEGQRDRLEFNLDSVPLPIIHKDFQINIRALTASRKLGQPLDVSKVAVATRLVSEQAESILFNGLSFTANGSSIYGYTTALNRNTTTLTANWALVGTTGETIVDDVMTMVSDLIGDNMYGPYRMYVPTSYYNKLLEDYKANSDKTILQRILEIPDIESVKQSKDLADGGAGEVLMIQMTSDVVDLIDGIQPTLVEWETHGGMVTNFKVMAILVPRMKSDYDTQSGIAHYTVV